MLSARLKPCPSLLIFYPAIFSVVPSYVVKKVIGLWSYQQTRGPSTSFGWRLTALRMTERER